MSRLLLVCLAPLFLISAAAEPDQDRPPNILFIAIDDLNDWVGALGGHPDAKTPHMDRLAARGTLFRQAHTQYPLCGPSRASVMSGFLPSTLGYSDHMSDEELKERTESKGGRLLHEYFSDHGYKTMAVGKICHQHVPEGTVDASGGREPFGPRPKLGLKWNREKTSTDWGAWPDNDTQTADYRTAQWAIERLSEPHQKPFLLMVGFLRPHVPWYAPQPWFDLHSPASRLQLPPYREDDWTDIPSHAAKIAIEPQYPTTTWAKANNEWANIVQAYLACTSFVDHQLGRVLDALDRSAYRDNTVIVLWSDHGYHLGEKGLFKKVTLWERSTRVPLIIAGPNLPVGHAIDSPVSLLDLYPTLTAACGLPPHPKSEGQNLLPLLQGKRQHAAAPSYTMLDGNNLAATDGRFRYIRYEDGSEELYDHQSDPHEWQNRASDPELSPVKKRLSQNLPLYRR